MLRPLKIILEISKMKPLWKKEIPDISEIIKELQKKGFYSGKNGIKDMTLSVAGYVQFLKDLR